MVNSVNNSTDTWLTPKKAIEELHKRNCNTMIGEKTLRTLIKQGFPCISIGNRKYINIDTFNEDIKAFSKKPCDFSIYQNKKTSDKRKGKINKHSPRQYNYNNGSIKRIEI